MLRLRPIIEPSVFDPGSTCWDRAITWENWRPGPRSWLFVRRSVARYLARAVFRILLWPAPRLEVFRSNWLPECRPPVDCLDPPSYSATWLDPLHIERARRVVFESGRLRRSAPELRLAHGAPPPEPRG